MPINLLSMHENEFGTKFNLYDDTDSGLDNVGHYLYRFKNLGETLRSPFPGSITTLTRYIEDHYVMDALIAAESYDVAIKHLTQTTLGFSYERYTFDVELIGIDLLADDGVRIIFESTKSPI